MVKPWNKAARNDAARKAFKDEVMKEVLQAVDHFARRQMLVWLDDAIRSAASDLKRAEGISKGIDTLTRLNPAKYGTIKEDLIELMTGKREGPGEDLPAELDDDDDDDDDEAEEADEEPEAQAACS